MENLLREFYPFPRGSGSTKLREGHAGIAVFALPCKATAMDQARRDFLLGLAALSVTKPLAAEQVAPNPEAAPAANFRIGTTAYTTLRAALAALKDGEILDIAPGDYPTDCGWSNASNITIRCAEEAIFHAAYDGKSALVLGGRNVNLAGLAGVGIANDSANGGLIRFEGVNLTADRIRIDSCETGILTGNAHADSIVALSNLRGTQNGTPGDGQSHAIYVGACAAFYLSGSTISDTNLGHLVKSRAAKTVVTDCKLDKVRASRCIDLCEGGVFVLDGNSSLINSTVTQNYQLIGYGAELLRDPRGWAVAKYPLNTFTVAQTVTYFGRDMREFYLRDIYRGSTFLQPTVYDDQHVDRPMPAPGQISSSRPP